MKIVIEINKHISLVLSFMLRMGCLNPFFRKKGVRKGHRQRIVREKVLVRFRDRKTSFSIVGKAKNVLPEFGELNLLQNRS